MKAIIAGTIIVQLVLFALVLDYVARHEHPVVTIEPSKICDCSQELLDVNKDLDVYKRIAQDMHALGGKMFSGLDLVNKWIKADRAHEDEQAAEIAKLRDELAAVKKEKRRCW